MRRVAFQLVIAAVAASPLLADPPRTKQLPPPLSTGAPATVPPVQTTNEERPLVVGRPVLISPEQANDLIQRFKAAYPKLGSPRIVIGVNRPTAEVAPTGIAETKPEAKADPTAPQNVAGSTAAVTNSTNSTGAPYNWNDRTNGAPADKETTRDLERLFGRPLRIAGANLTDRSVALQLIAEALGKDSKGEPANRDALLKGADVAIEILVSSHSVPVTGLSGDRTIAVPDIHATAVRLSDSRIIGQATASDVIGNDANAANLMRFYDFREIAEATVLVLMEDILTNAPK